MTQRTSPGSSGHIQYSPLHEATPPLSLDDADDTALTKGPHRVDRGEPRCSRRASGAGEPRAAPHFRSRVHQPAERLDEIAEVVLGHGVARHAPDVSADFLREPTPPNPPVHMHM
eukprot:1182358-Prorocentrum_minimum.AAC.2